MARQVSVGELRARCSQVIEECRRSGDVCVVTRRGKPVGVLAPWGQELRDGEAAGLLTGGAPGPVQLAAADGPDASDAAMDSATWGQWESMSVEDRAAMVMAQSLIRGSAGDAPSPEPRPGAGWGAWKRGE